MALPLDAINAVSAREKSICHGHPSNLHLWWARRLLAKSEPSSDEILKCPECAWIDRDLANKAQGYAVAYVEPEHLAEVKAAKLPMIEKPEAAIKERLTKGINYLLARAEEPN